MGINIENVAKQIAVLGPTTQAKLFESLAELTGRSSLKELAESYQRLLDQSQSPSSAEAMTIETKTPLQPRPYPSADERDSQQHDRIGESLAAYGSVQDKVSEDGKRYQELYAIFDGEVLRPEGEINLDLNTRYRMLVEKSNSKFPEIKNRALRRIAARAVPMGIRDFAEQHDHYLYGLPKK
jgi:hypothetical protein